MKRTKRFIWIASVVVFYICSRINAHAQPYSLVMDFQFDNTDITFNVTGGNTPYDVVWSGGSTLNNINDGHTITVSPTTTTNYTISAVTDNKGCPATGSLTPVTITVQNPPNTNNVIGSSNACQGATTTYTTNPAAGATSYTWTIPNGAVIASGQGTNSITVNWPPAATSGDVCVTAINGCNPEVERCRSVNFIPVPAAPANINGPGTACRNTQQDFSIADVPDAVSYVWTAPPGASILSGQGSTDVTVNFSSAAQSGNLCVRSVAASSCGQSTNTCLPIVIVPNPVSPVFIAPPSTTPCVGTTQVYTVNTQASVDSYFWDTNGAGDIVDGQGTSSVTVLWTTDGATTLSVTANSSICFNDATANRNITVRPLADAPASISSSQAACVGNTVIYTASPVSGASAYAWDTGSINSFGVVIGPTNTTQLQVQWLFEGTVPVTCRAINTCGVGNPLTELIPVGIPPPMPGIISGATSSCAGAQVIYSITGVYSASSYQWSVPTNAQIISGQGTQQITVQLNGAGNASVCVQAVNACGSSAQRCINVTVNNGANLSAGSISGPNQFCPIAASNYSIATVPGATAYQWSLLPGASNTAGQNTTNIAVNWGTASNGQVCVSAVGGCGVGTPSCTTVAPLSGLAVNLGNDTTLCPGSSLLLSAGVGAGTYTWSTAATTNSITVSASSTYSVTISTGVGNTCTASDAIAVTFAAANPPAAVAQLSTPLNTTNVPVNTPIAWSIPAGCVGGYTISIGTTPGGNQIAGPVNTSTNNYQSVGSLPAATTIYVTIVPTNIAGNGPSAIFSFTTAANIVNGCNPVSDSLEVVNFFNTHNGWNWQQQYWLDINIPLGEWEGITCDNNGCITAINLAGKEIIGPLTDLNLPKLEHLIIRRARIQGVIPNFQNLPNLRILILSNNELSGLVPDFSQIPNLEVMDIDTNFLSGQLPNFQYLPALYYLDFNNNNLDGFLPPFDQMGALSRIDLSNNKITGSIQDYSHLVQLTFLGLSDNRLMGLVPQFSNPLLRYVYLNNNRLSGQLPLFTAQINKIALGLDRNKFTFDGLPAALVGFQEVAYQPQDSVSHDTTLFRNTGENLLFSLDFDESVAGSVYRWYRNGIFQFELYTNDLVINNLDPALHNGSWHVQVTNAGAPDLILYSEEIVLQIQGANCPPNATFTQVSECITGSTYTKRFQTNCTDAIGILMVETNIGNAVVPPSGFEVEITEIPMGVPLNITVSFDCWINLEAIVCSYPHSFTAFSGTPTSITSASGSTIICSGGSTNLSVPNVSSAVFSWYLDGVAIANTNAPSIMAILPGTYVATWRVGTGCTHASLPIILTTANSPSPLLSANTPCTNETLTLEETSGTATGWSWSGPQSYSSNVNPATRENMSTSWSGAYTVTVSNSEGCTATASTIVNVQNFSIATFVNFTHCLGNVENTINSSVGSVTFDWDDLPGTDDPEDRYLLPAGSYAYTATDQGSGCTRNTELTLSNLNSITATAELSPANCGTNNGTIQVNVTGGQSPYDFTWSDLSGSGQPQFRNNLSAGTYTVTVSESSTSECWAILELEVLSEGNSGIQINSLDYLPSICGQNNGYINLATDLPAVVVDWADLPGTTDPIDRFGLGAGTYSVTVTDAGGCTSSTSVVLSEIGTSPMLSIVPTAAACGQTNGSIALTPTGSGPFNFDWNDLVGTNDPQNRTGLSTGTYSVTVTDVNGCTGSSSVTVVQSGNPPSLTALPIAAACGQTNGSIGITPTGSGPFNFDWNDLVGTNNPQNRTALGAGNYTVTVTDANGCTTSSSVTVGQSGTPPTVSATPTAAACGQTNGSITLSPSGSAPFNFDWNDLTGSNDPQNRTALGASTYTVIVTDANGCTGSNSIAVGQTGIVPTITTVIQPATCGLPNGAINLTLTTGTLPFQFDWADFNGNNDLQDRSNLGAGGYQLTVTDALGCTNSFSFNIVATGVGITAAVNSVGATCDQNNGTINIVPQSGQLPFSFDWEDLNLPIEPQNRNALSAGNYQVTITDATNCTLNLQVVVTGTQRSVSVQSDTICAQDSVRFNGIWYRETGIYNDTLWDASANGCDSIIVLNLTILGCDTVPDGFDFESLKPFIPNVVVPQGAELNRDFDPLAALSDFGFYFAPELVNMTIYNRWGEIVWRANPYQPWPQQEVNQRPAGPYFYLLEIGEGCITGPISIVK
jgi:PKD-like domain/SprB repeat/CHU_C Type IX secretion signal domain